MIRKIFKKAVKASLAMLIAVVTLSVIPSVTSKEIITSVQAEENNSTGTSITRHLELSVLEVGA